jgi:hypothetical protein
MSKIARKLVLSIVTVVLTVFALGTTTFAWFTLTNTAQVQPFQAQIIADTGIEISIGDTVGDPVNKQWVTQLTTASVEAWINATYPGFRFNHVTTLDGSTYNTLGMTSLTEAAGGWLEIPIHFRSNSSDTIFWTNVTLTSGLASWVPDVDFIGASGNPVTSGNSIQVDAAHAMRISIEKYAAGLTNGFVVYELPAAGANVVLGTGGNLADGVGVGLGNAGAMNFYYQKTGMLPFGADNVSVIESQTSIVSEEVLVMNSGQAIFAGANYYGRIVIRIWVEGWDANAYNSILNRFISASFTFVGNE